MRARTRAKLRALARAVVPAVGAFALTFLLALPAAAQTPPGSEIVNLAVCEYGEAGGPYETDWHRVSSNPVTTTVAMECFATAAELDVTPDVPVAPGDLLLFDLTVHNPHPVDLRQVLVELPLDAALADPQWFTSDGGVPPPAPGIDVSASYDPVERVVTWTLERLPASGRAMLQVAASARTDLSGETRFTMSGTVRAEGCLEDTPTTPVEVEVIPRVLEISKRADRSGAVPGDAVRYRLEVTHTGTEPDLQRVALEDALPAGLRYVPGSARLDGEAAPDPAADLTGRILRFEIGSMAAGTTRVVEYAALVSPLAERGEAVNIAVAEGTSSSGTPFRSDPASATVSVFPGPFRTEATLVGRVFVDADGDGRPGEGEAGVPGVLVHLENGRGSVTDASGRWHIERVRPGLHVLRIDPSTLPPGLAPIAAGAGWAGDSWTRFVEVRAATLAVADLPTGPPDAPVCRVEAARAGLVVPRSVLSRPDGVLDGMADWLAESGGRGPVRVECAEESGGVPAELAGRLSELLSARVRRSSAERLGEDAAAVEEDPADDPLESILRTAAPGTRILSPVSGSRMPRSQVDVEVLYPIDCRPSLEVNGRPVPASRIGVEASLPSRGLAAARYVGVALDAGSNELLLRAIGPDDVLAEDPGFRAVLLVAGEASGLRLSVPGDRWLTGRDAPATLVVEAVDASGTRVRGRRIVDLEVAGAQPRTADHDPTRPGWQVLLENGVAEVRFAPPVTPGRVNVVARDEDMEAELSFPILPGADTWSVTGLAEARAAGDGGVEGDGGLPPGGLEQSSGDGGRIAVFARGPVGKASQLTARIDTAREPDRDRLHEGDFEPEQLYPVYGDGSTRIEEAEAQGEVYVRFDGPRGFARYGDFESGFDRTELGRYQRHLTGLSGRLEHGVAAFEGFAVSTDQVPVREVFTPDGTSGPYLLTRIPVVARSETVTLELRDRHETDRILRRERKLRDVHYNLDPRTGALLFRDPLQPFDGDANPYRIVVTYETRGAGGDRIAAGGRLSARWDRKIEAGATAVLEERALEDLHLFGADLTWRPTPGTSVRGEIAGTDDGEDHATAYALELSSRHGSKLSWEASYRDLPASFSNPSYLGSPDLGSRSAGARVSWAAAQDWRIRGETFHQEDSATGIERTVASAVSEHQVGRVTFLAGGTQVESEDPARGDVSSTLARAGARARLGRRWSAELSRDQALGGETAPGFPTRTRAGVAFDLAAGARAFLRHEEESGDGTTRDRTLFGIEGRVGRFTRARAGYALEGGADGAALRATSGVETVLPIGTHHAVRGSASRLDTTRGDGAGDFTSLAGAYEYRAGRSLATSRYELRLGDREDRHLWTAAGAVRVGSAWTVFARERLFLTDPAGAGKTARAEGLLGFAFRPLHGRLQWLSRLDHATGSSSAVGVGAVPPGGVATEPAGSVTSPSTVPIPAGTGVGPGREATVVARDTWALSLAAGIRLSARQRAAATWIGRRVSGEDSSGIPATLTHLTSLHYTADLGDRWTAGGSLRRYLQPATGISSYGYGTQVGFLVVRNLWIAAGWNFAGIEDEDFPGNDRTREGPFLALRFKFDERSLRFWEDPGLFRGPRGGSGRGRRGPAP